MNLSPAITTVKCKNCVNLNDHWCKLIIDSPDEELDRMCGSFKQKTNADCIRAMSDEELAELLHNAGGSWFSEEYWLSWLQKPDDRNHV